MNNKEIIKALNNLIEDFNDYSTDYTKTACDYYKEIFIEIKKQLEEKEKIIDDAIKYAKNTTVAEHGTEEIFNISELWFVKELLEILERGKK